MAYVCIATWRLRGDTRTRVLEWLDHLAAASRLEDGCVVFHPYLVPGEPLTLRILEIYLDEAAFATHGTSTHFQQFGERGAFPLLEGRSRELIDTAQQAGMADEGAE